MALTYITTCTLCAQRFTVPGFEDLLTTDIGRAKLGEVFEKLHIHVKDTHKQQFAMAALPGAQLARLLVLVNFRTDDPIANQMREYMRYQLHMQTKARAIQDEQITQQVRDLRIGATQKKLPAEFHASIIGLMKQMRDIIEERGEFEPKQPAITTGPQLVAP